MLRPDIREFLRLARQHALVPVVKSVSADLLTPVSAFLTVARREPYAFLLESVEGGEKIGRYTFLGVRPYLRVSSRGSETRIERGDKREQRQGNIFETLRELLAERQMAPLPGLPPFAGGAVGFFGYDAVRQLEPVATLAKQDVQIPDCILMFFDRLLAFDHLRHQIHIIAAADVRSEAPRRAYARALRDIQALEKKLSAGMALRGRSMAFGGNGKLPRIQRTASRKQFLQSVARAKKYIAAGDIYQVVLSERLDLEIKSEPFDIYRALRALNPSPYMYFLRMGEMTVLGSSPEMLVRVQGRALSYRPIAGTRPRGRNESDDQRLEQQLLHDEKERAEHVMLVDLGRNDVGRVSEYGSVKVRELMFVERYSHVMHLVSAIEGKLRADLVCRLLLEKKKNRSRADAGSGHWRQYGNLQPDRRDDASNAARVQST